MIIKQKRRALRVLTLGEMGVSAGKNPPKKVLCKKGQGEEEHSRQGKLHGDKSLR